MGKSDFLLLFCYPKNKFLIRNPGSAPGLYVVCDEHLNHTYIKDDHINAYQLK